MKKSCTALVIGAFASAISASTTTVFADDYVGVSLGQSRARMNAGDFVPSTTPASIDNKDTAWKVFAGRRLSQYASVEIAYADLGRASVSIPGPIGATESLDTVAWSATLVGTMPIPAAQVGIFAKLGPALTSTTAKVSQPGLSFAQENTELGWMGGLGASWQLARSWSVRVEWERYWKVAKNFTNNAGGFDIDVFSLGGAYHF